MGTNGSIFVATYIALAITTEMNNFQISHHTILEYSAIDAVLGMKLDANSAKISVFNY